ncbi:alpha-tubulin N-acetyltransferase [Condylostylus longicornis]|uniref:alpha-tubulin N-acetyltransferase n=1 Tax=Condylostylus longicornis TaxID=2530218 RepID=UPI00244E582B|nr:alpha-tubulin N-acetyltransferase [Condylostylus longicornis]
MEFRFDLKPIFSQPIARVGVNLLPHTFRGDRRSALDTSTKMQEIINTVGENSARAQGLSKAVTTAQKLRQSENQKIYLLVDVDDGKRGSVIGMLKVGNKSLYVFDQTGTTQMVEAPCILDFYIHESRQRAGLGKDLFETMLQEEQWDPRKLAIDRPSDKLLGFLKKHYGLEKTIPQMNNFVIFEGFFDKTENGNVINNNNYDNQNIKITSSPNTALFGPLITSDDRLRRSRAENTASLNPLTGIQNNPIGRYAAARPTCSMAEIIHSTSAKKSTGEPNSYTPSNDDQQSHVTADDIENVRSDFEQIEVSDLVTEPDENGPEPVEPDTEPEAEIQNEPETEQELNDTVSETGTNGPTPSVHSDAAGTPTINLDSSKRQTLVNDRYRGNKQHTGMKNMSFGVGAAVTPTTKMEFYQEQPADFGIVKINQPGGKSFNSSNDDNASVISSVTSGDGFTGQGYYDLKFHHNKLW